MKKQYLPSQFAVGDIYRISYTDRHGNKSKRNILVTFTPCDTLMPVFCLTRRAYRTLTIASITKAKNITSALHNAITYLSKEKLEWKLPIV